MCDLTHQGPGYTVDEQSMSIYETEMAACIDISASDFFYLHTGEISGGRPSFDLAHTRAMIPTFPGVSLFVAQQLSIAVGSLAHVHA